jgi:hypothetical protein
MAMPLTKKEANMVDSIANVLRRRDELTKEQAEAQVEELRSEFFRRLENSEDVWDLMDDVGLEPDYLEELL